MLRILCAFMITSMLQNAVIGLFARAGKTLQDFIPMDSVSIENTIENTIYGVDLRASDELCDFYIYGEIVNDNDVSVEVSRVYYSVLCDGKEIHNNYTPFIIPYIIPPHEKAYYYDITYLDDDILDDIPSEGEITYAVTSHDMEVGSSLTYAKLPSFASYNVDENEYCVIIENDTDFWLSDIPYIVFTFNNTDGALAFVSGYSDAIYMNGYYMAPPGKSMHFYGLASRAYIDINLSSLPDIDYESFTAQAWGRLLDEDGDTEYWNAKFNIKE